MQQAFFKSQDDELPAPVAYAVGLTLAILPPQVGLLALPIGVIMALAVKNLSASLMLTATVTAVLGKLFDQSLTTVITASALLTAPVLISLLFHRELGLTVRRITVAPRERLRDIPIQVRH